MKPVRHAGGCAGKLLPFWIGTPIVRAADNMSTEELAELRERLARVEERAERAERIALFLLRPVGAWYPLFEAGISEDEAYQAYGYLSQAGKDALRGQGPSPADFSAEIGRLVPCRAGDPKFPGRVVTFCFRGYDTLPLYEWLKDRGLPGINEAVEDEQPDWRQSLQRRRAEGERLR